MDGESVAVIESSNDWSVLVTVMFLAVGVTRYSRERFTPSIHTMRSDASAITTASRRADLVRRASFKTSLISREPFIPNGEMRSPLCG